MPVGASGRTDRMEFAELAEERHSIRAFREREMQRARLDDILHGSCQWISLGWRIPAPGGTRAVSSRRSYK